MYNSGEPGNEAKVYQSSTFFMTRPHTKKFGNPNKSTKVLHNRNTIINDLIILPHLGYRPKRLYLVLQTVSCWPGGACGLDTRLHVGRTQGSKDMVDLWQDLPGLTFRRRCQLMLL